ncbi:hypothetical protein [Bryobacter aggregatus]|uniref:hypothetical protein n=1 Tax=Bryobacter aggregatus TaxID=360054 RepID=UPI00068EFB19|nr:hypothetical protein [Bryobacter aggregatus]
MSQNAPKKRLICLWQALFCASLFAQTPVVKNQGFLPFADAPIGYRASKTLNDQITQLNRQLDSGKIQLAYEPDHGYLKSVLAALGVPATSQTLVYSKTSLQFQHISPKTPRALYFNDNVYVGQVLNSKSLELIAFDATQGAVFYVLNEQQVDKPRFERAQLDCVQCHIATATRGIPGVMVRSVVTAPSGYPKGGAPIYTMGHETPIEKRWGGWYVTGTQGKENLEGVVDTSRFLTRHSDVVAHLVLAHQTQMHNLVTETNYRYRLGLHNDAKKASAPVQPSAETRQQYETAAEAALRYLLFTREAALPAGLHESSTFTKDFSALGPRDRKGRSLRDFDLEKRIFKYPCSYLIYSDAFDAIPGPARDYLLQRLFEVLSGRDQSPDFAAVSAEDRRAILEILVDTKPGLPEDWKQFLGQPVSQVSAPAPPPAQLQR